MRDAQSLRAITHPLRLELLRLLIEEGQLTSTTAAGLLGESTATCSFHLRQLAKYGFVEEAGGATGRNRPWKLTRTGMRFSTSLAEDPEAGVAAAALGRLTRDRQLARLVEWGETRSGYPTVWREAASSAQFNLYLTAEELAGLEADFIALFLPRFQERIDDPAKRPDGSAPVEALFFAYPTRPPQPAPVTPRKRASKP